MAVKQESRSSDYPFAPRSGPWQDRVAYASNGLVAYRPDELISRGDDDRAKTIAYLREITDGDVRVHPVFDDFALIEATEAFDVERAILELRERGVGVEANVVFFTHCGCGCGCGGGCNPDGFAGYPFNSNPFNSNPFNSNPFNSNPFNSNPFNSNPFNSNPFNSNPFNSNGWAATGERPSSARPAGPPPKGKAFPRGKGRAIVLDTGIAEVVQLPDLLDKKEHQQAADADREAPDLEGDGFLDASSGHGTFIAGVIEQLAPGHIVRCARVLGNFGDGDAAAIAHRLDQLLPTINEYTILNMSFGSYGDPDLHLLSAAIGAAQSKGAVIVSSAGNDGTCLRSFPAALSDVVGVGSIDGGGRAHYSNFGNWVRACAPGTNVISSFYRAYNGDSPTIPGEGDPDDFAEWARWTGTSFAAPIVVAALLRNMAMTGVTAKEAVVAVIDDERLGRFPGLGTVVNLVPGM